MSTTEDTGINGLAWDSDRQQFWVSSLNGEVYPVRRDVAVTEGRLEPARGRSFSGNYLRLAYGAGYLWGADYDRRQICKINVKD